MIEVYEFYENDVTQFDPATGKRGLFVQYINTFLMLKAEASVNPTWVRTPDDEDRVVQSFNKSEGILLNKHAIRPSRELYRFLATPGIELMSLIFASADVVWLFWKFTAEEITPILRHNNEVIAAYVTTGARIHLYRYLELLEERALYCDTVSVFDIQDESEPSLIACGDNLGDMTDELNPGEYIDEFVSGGSKNYAYKIHNRDDTKEPKTVCKVRGITLNYHASRLVNFDVIRRMIL
jgi:hypothetical protein